jgi:SOS-response transcriptional repressor LexA
MLSIVGYIVGYRRMPRKPMQEMSDLQGETLKSIASLYERHGRRGLTVQEVADEVGRSWNATKALVDQLIRKQKVTMVRGVPRSLRPLPKEF